MEIAFNSLAVTVISLSPIHKISPNLNQQAVQHVHCCIQLHSNWQIGMIYCSISWQNQIDGKKQIVLTLNVVSHYA